MILLPNGMPVYMRDEWGADTAKWTWSNRTRESPISMNLPVSLAYLHHSVTRVTDNKFADMRTVEDIGMQRFGRFSYSWAWHPSGCWMQGCGDWVGAHTLNQNSKSLGLVLIGNYDVTEPPARLVDDVRVFVDWLERTNRLNNGIYPTTDHQGTGASTACAGKYARMLLPLMRVPWVTPKPPVPKPEPPKPTPTPPEEDDMAAQPYRFYKFKGDNKVWLVPVTHATRQHVTDQTILTGHREALYVESLVAKTESWSGNVFEVDPTSNLGKMLASIPIVEP